MVTNEEKKAIQLDAFYICAKQVCGYCKDEIPKTNWQWRKMNDCNYGYCHNLHGDKYSVDIFLGILNQFVPCKAGRIWEMINGPSISS